MRLSQSDLERINVAIATLYEVASVEELLARILSTTARLVENCWVSFNESNILKGGNHSATLCSSSAPGDLSRSFPVLHSLMHQHPALLVASPRRASAALTFEDGLPRRQIERLPLYNEYYRRVGTRDQLVMFLSPGRTVTRCVSVSRDRANFSNRDRTVMAFLRPHFDRAYRNISLLEATTKALATLAASQRKRSLLAIDREGRIEFAPAPARQWLFEAFPRSFQAADRAPVELLDWLRRTEPGAGRLVPPLRRSSASGAMLCHVVHRSDDRAMVVLERGAPPLAHHWSQLTPREREVLGWVARAKTNPEIARILEMKVRTVEKHMENILAKLALENRASAMLAAIEAGLDTPVS